MKSVDDAKYIVNEYGEVIDEAKEGQRFVILEEGERILRRDNIEPFEKTVEIRMRFAKVNFLVIGDICRKYSIFPYLIQYVGYMSGKLMFRNGRIITRDKLPSVCGVSDITIKRQLKGLLEDDILKKVVTDEGTAFFVNPFVVHFGKRINQSLYEMFENTEYRHNYEKVLGDASDFTRDGRKRY